MATKVEVGFELTADTSNFFHLNDATKGKLNNPDYRLAGPIWIDISDDVTSVSIQRGKNRELDRYSASTASVVLNNENRYYDPMNDASPYVGNIIPRRAIRISTAGYPQFNGVIEDWNLDYDVAGKSNATIVAADAFTLFAGQNLTAGTATTQLTGARINAILSQPSVAWPLERREIDAGSQYVGVDVWETTDNALSYLQTVADSEQGQMFVDNQGKLRFINGVVSPSQGNLVTLATNLMPNPSFETDIGNYPIRENFIANPNFETNVSSWTLLGSTLTRDTVTKYAGAASMKVVTTGVATGQGAYSAPTDLGYGAGIIFSVSAYVNAPAGATMEILAASTGSGASNVTTTFTGTGAWQLVKAEGATTGTGGNAYIVIRTRSTAQAITFYVDNAISEFGSKVGEYFDGSSTGADLVTYSWAGTANASFSFELAPQPYWTTGLYCAAVQSDVWVASGSRSMRLTRVVDYYPSMDFAKSGVTVGDYLEPGQTYTIGVTRYLPAPLTGTLGTYAGVIAVVDGSDPETYLVSTALPNTAGTESITYTVTIPETWQPAFIVLGYGATVPEAGDVYYDDLYIVKHTVDNPYTDGYFDGSTTGTLDTFYSWTGTVNDSESVKQTTSYAKFSDAGDGIPYTNIAVSYGSELLYNQATVSSNAGTAIANNTTSQTTYGISATQVDTLLSTSNAVTSLSQFYVSKYGEPDYRFETLEVSLEGMETTQAQQLLALDLGDIVEIQFTPNGTGSAIFKYGQISKIAHTVSPAVHRIVYGFNSMQFSYLVLDDTGFGQLDVNVMAF